jgi:hypothetical protein
MKLKDIARVIRSKNAGPFMLTLDILMPSVEAFNTVKESGALNTDVISRLYHVPREKIRIIHYVPGLAIKITMPRRVPSGDVADTDVYGAQQHTPLMGIEVI